MNRLLPTTMLRRGDTVTVLAGNDRGKQGRILKVLPKRAMAFVDGVNLVTRHVKPSTKAPQGGRIEKAAVVHLSNLQLVCPSCSKPTKLMAKQSGETKEYVCRLCKAAVVRKGSNE